MAYEVNVGQDFSYFKAAADLSSSQFYLVVVNSSGTVALAGADVACLGVLQNTPTSGQTASVRAFGVSKVEAGGTFAIGDKLASDANGKAVKATTASVSAGTPEPLAGSHVIGIALEAGTSGQLSTVALTHAGLTN